MAAAHPRAAPSSLTGYTVAFATKLDVAPIIANYEWLGTMGRATVFVALVAPDGELHGAACFGAGPGPSTGISQLIGSPALCLERGACVHYAPRNAASFLINGACKLVHQALEVPLFYAYGDPEAGEYGGVYQAAGWLYLGQGLNGRNGRTTRDFWLAPGLDPAVPTNWRTTRDIFRPRHGGWHMTYDEARAKGWIKKRRGAKHVYAVHVGRYRRQWRAAMLEKIKRSDGLPPPYPKPNPSEGECPCAAAAGADPAGVSG